MTTPSNTDAGTSAALPGASADAAAPVTRRAGINWLRFWLQMFAAMMVFNVIAGLVTWFFIFPHLHPAH